MELCHNTKNSIVTADWVAGQAAVSRHGQARPRHGRLPGALGVWLSERGAKAGAGARGHAGARSSRGARGPRHGHAGCDMAGPGRDTAGPRATIRLLCALGRACARLGVLCWARLGVLCT